MEQTETQQPEAARRPALKKRPQLGRILSIGLPILLLLIVVTGTKWVGLDSTAAAGPKVFTPATYGKKTFPKQQAAIVKKAVPAATLAAAIAKDQAAATKQYGVPGDTGAEFAVSFTGTAGKPESGVYPITVPGLPKDLLVRVQMGPAINGTGIRDATGTIKFGDFTNQIDYQNAASALNNELKTEVLSKVDAANLQGKTVDVTGVFQLINPKGWLVTPVKVAVK